MKLDYSEKFNELLKVLQGELKAIIESFANEDGNYGFALAIPEDAGSACLMYAVGNESKLVGEQAGSRVWLDRRYSPVEWVDDWADLPRSNDVLERIVVDFESKTSVPKMNDAESDEAHDQFIADCAKTCMEAMLACERQNLFGKIWYKTLFMSDDEHPILVEAFQKLNNGRALTEAAPLFDFQ
ncbi:MAG: DUF4303 domain-containing protein [Methyloligellaceae bacterium]